MGVETKKCTCSNPMACSSSQASQIKYVLLLCLLFVSKLKGEVAKTMSDNALYPEASFSSPTPQTKHNVFISFRGPDIRRGFLSHLIKVLSQNQIDTFVDEELERGDEISKALLEAIERSFISLVIFSPDFASSHWCLEELVKILECRKKDRQIVIPIFYNVDPSDVRNQNGNYGEALVKHGERYNSSRVLIWKSVLKECADLSGFHSSKFRDDAELIEEILKSLLSRLNVINQVNSKAVIGINKPIATLTSMLQQKLEDVLVIGIWGMGGIGKTTIAEELFKRLCFEYERCCFLANIREESRRRGILFLKKKLFSTLLNKDLKIIDTPNGLPKYVEKRLSQMKVFVVLDDINDSTQLDNLVGAREQFGSGSRIIVTTTNQQVLHAYGVDDIYKVRELGFDDSLKLFHLFALKQKQVEMEYFELSKRVIQYAKGIPLVLKVLGHLLCGKNKEVWESQLEKLKKMPSEEVYKAMRLSYDDLDPHEQKIFLDLACFFNGMNLKLDYIKTLLKDHEYDHLVAAGLESLKDKALLTISEDNVVSVHDIIQKMAWEIVRQESNLNPEHRSRLWDDKEIYPILKSEQGSETIRSITMQLSAVEKLELSPRVFAKMSKLRFLDFHNNTEYRDCLELPHGLQPLPIELRYLRWMNYPSKSLPEKFSAEKLVIIDLSYSKVEKLWHGVQDLVNLKFVTVHDSIYLNELPDFSKATNLEVLDISGCKNLREFSIISKNVIELDLGFTSINALPTSIRNQSKLEILRLRNTYIESLPTSINHLTKLRYLDVRFCKDLRTLPKLPPSIETLYASHSKSLETVLFPSTVDEQLKENRKLVLFWNCLKLDTQSRSAIGLNAKINMVKLAYQRHLSSPKRGYVEGSRKDNDSDTKYVYPGSSVPEWLEYRTTKNYLTIDLSSPSRSPLLGLIFYFIIPKDPSWQNIKFNISINAGGEGEEGNGVSIKMDLFKPLDEVASDHVYVKYDLQCSGYLKSKPQNQSRFKINVTVVATYKKPKGQGSFDMPMVLKEFGVYPITISSYSSIQSMKLDDYYRPNISASFNFNQSTYWVLGIVILCLSFLCLSFLYLAFRCLSFLCSVVINLKRRKSIKSM